MKAKDKILIIASAVFMASVLYHIYTLYHWETLPVECQGVYNRDARSLYMLGYVLWGTMLMTIIDGDYKNIGTFAMKIIAQDWTMWAVFNAYKVHRGIRDYSDMETGFLVSASLNTLRIFFYYVNGGVLWKRIKKFLTHKK